MRLHMAQNNLCQCKGRRKARLMIWFVVTVLLSSWMYRAIQPPSPNVCGTPKGPIITASRIKLRDGRHLAYIENGVPKDTAKYKVISVHAFWACRLRLFPASQELLEELGVYIVGFDRAGYGQSDPFPQRSLKSEALDVEELADQLQLGSEFYVVAISMGGYTAWSCLKYIPHRLAGVAMVVPGTNYWWRGFPSRLKREAFALNSVGDRIALSIAHHVPWLTYFWMTQKWFPTSCMVNGGIHKYLSKPDLQLLARGRHNPPQVSREAVQQGVFESLHRDMIVQFGKWDFSPLDLGDPLKNNASVHIWQGDEDYLSSVLLNRYIGNNLPWINYYELAGVGHFIDFIEGMPDQMLKALLSSNQPSVA